ncbi:MAG: cupin domain protein [Rhodospirillales bacterium]|jgi:mannose-6-phosphate isomerase-like protein (cupin superfamily)|nr:cupin domain protein [Rhodospirillales bacterium]
MHRLIDGWIRTGLSAGALVAVGACAAAAPHPEISLQELVGRAAADHSERVSVALFRFTPGTVARATYDKLGEEIFIVAHGHGEVLRGADIIPVGPGSVIRVPALVIRSLRVTGVEPFEFYAITAPAWTEDDDVEVPSPAGWGNPNARPGG